MYESIPALSILIFAKSLARHLWSGGENAIGVRLDLYGDYGAFAAAHAKPSESSGRAAGLTGKFLSRGQLPNLAKSRIQRNPDIDAFRQERFHDKRVVVVDKQADIARAFDPDKEIAAAAHSGFASGSAQENCRDR